MNFLENYVRNLSGKNISEAREVLKGASRKGANYIFKNSPDAPGYENATRIYGKATRRAAKAFEDAKATTRRTRLATGVGVGALGAAGIGGAMHSNHSDEKTAFDIVNESFEKTANVLDNIRRSGNRAKGAIQNAIMNRKLKTGAPRMAKELASKGDVRRRLQNLSELDEKMYSASKMRKRVGTGIAAGAGVGAGAAGAGYAYKRHNKEKTAFDIVNESFEKTANTLVNIRGNGNRIKSAIQNARMNRKLKTGAPRMAKELAIKGDVRRRLQNLSELDEKMYSASKTRKRVGAGIAAGTGVGALGAAGAGYAYKRHNREKTAFDIVNESFEKIG